MGAASNESRRSFRVSSRWCSGALALSVCFRAASQLNGMRAPALALQEAPFSTQYSGGAISRIRPPCHPSSSLSAPAPPVSSPRFSLLFVVCVPPTLLLPLLLD